MKENNKLVLNQETLKNLTNEKDLSQFFKSTPASDCPRPCTPVAGMN